MKVFVQAAKETMDVHRRWTEEKQDTRGDNALAAVGNGRKFKLTR